ncbi:MAG: hypothetical protein ABI353_04390 [Isosphaeraceae bacterium]
MIVILVVIEGYVNRHPGRFGHPWGHDWRHGSHAARREAPGCEVLCFGDSLVKQSVIPQVLEGRLGGPVYNLALGAGPPPASYFLLRRALEAGAHPRAVLVDFIPHLLAEGPRFSEQLLPEVTSLRDCLDLGWTSADPSLFASLALARILPTVRDRFEIRANALGALQGLGIAASRHLLLVASARNWRVNRGAMIAAKTNRPPGDDTPHASALYPDSWQCAPVNATYVRRFLDLAGSRDIQVFLLVPPFSPEVHNRREQLGLEAQYTRFMESIQANYPNLVVIDARRSSYGPEVHADALHLDRQGAEVFSADLADLIAQTLADPTTLVRSYNLPPFRARSLALAVEDTDQSMQRLGTEPRRRR